MNLYGSPQNSALWDIHKDLNDGMGEGIFYRGRILMAVTVEIFSSPSMAERKLGDKTKSALSKLKLKKKSKKSKEKAKELRQLKGEEEAGDSQEAEQPEEVTVEVEELHPLPEVSPAKLVWLTHAGLWRAQASWGSGSGIACCNSAGANSACPLLGHPELAEPLQGLRATPTAPKRSHGKAGASPHALMSWSREDSHMGVIPRAQLPLSMYFFSPWS